jgi:DNA-binding PadR family transcriptional regulator
MGLIPLLTIMNETHKLTDVQMLFLEAVGADKVSGRQLREKLAKLGWRKSAPVFYQFAARLEDEKLIKGWYEQRTIAGQPVRERYYMLTAHGKQAVVETLHFYEERLHNNAGFLGGAPGYAI